MTPLTGDLFDDGDGEVLRLPADLHRLHEARRFVCDAIAPWGGAAPEEAALMTSELVGNAIKHSGDEIALRVSRDGPRALVEVQDHSRDLPKLQPPDTHRVGGHGLHIIEALASSWGVTRIHGNGKIVWFELPLPA